MAIDPKYALGTKLYTEIQTDKMASSKNPVEEAKSLVTHWYRIGNRWFSEDELEKYNG